MRFMTKNKTEKLNRHTPVLLIKGFEPTPHSSIPISKTDGIVANN